MFQLTAAKEAELLLDNPAFQDRWKNLFRQCPWATSFQDVEFVRAWYETYRGLYQPVVLTETTPRDQLIGLLTLAVSADGRSLVVAGGYQAEYHTWLALPDGTPSFMEGAI